MLYPLSPMNLNQQLGPRCFQSSLWRRTLRHPKCILIIPAGLSAALALFTAGCEKPVPPAAQPPAVQVMATIATNAPLGAEFIGQLDSPQNVEVRARVE